jgi:hypothetical protein
MTWPGHINDPGGIRRQFHHVIDAHAFDRKLLDAVDRVGRRDSRGFEDGRNDGTAYTWNKANANAPTQHTTQYFEMLGSRASPMEAKSPTVLDQYRLRRATSIASSKAKSRPTCQCRRRPSTSWW